MAKRITFILALLVIGLAHGESSSPEPGDSEETTLQNTAFAERAERSIRLELNGGEALDFRNTRLVRNDEGLLVACGEVEGGEAIEGQPPGFVRFVSMGHPESAYIEGRTVDFAEIWSRYCASSS